MRADSYLANKKLTRSRTEATTLIQSGQIKVNGVILQKPSVDIKDTDVVEILSLSPFVSRGGEKLAGALDQFNINVTDLTAIDIGSSTGGFTDCLLKRRARQVYAVDVGTAQLAESLRTDSRVVIMEQTDIRKLDKIDPQISLAVIDVSFIPLSLILPDIYKLLSSGATVVALVKPQFEVTREQRNKQGVVKKEEDQKAALEKVKKIATDLGFTVKGEMESPLLGGEGNREYLLYLRK